MTCISYSSVYPNQFLEKQKVTFMTNKTATIIENMVLFVASAYAYAIIRNKWSATVKGKNEDAI